MSAAAPPLSQPAAWMDSDVAVAPAAVDEGEMLRSHLSTVLLSTDEAYITKLVMLNQLFGKSMQKYPLMLSDFSEYLALYPVLLRECFADLSREGPESDALLQSCLESVYTLVVTLMSDELSAKALLATLARMLRLSCSAHAFVSEFFRAAWKVLHDRCDDSFRLFEVRVLCDLIRDSGAPTDRGPAHREQWFLNDAQSKMVELLAQIAPTLSAEHQTFVFRHFNPLLQPRTATSSPFAPLGVDFSSQFPLAAQSAFFLRVDIAKLDPAAQNTFYTHTLSCCLEEVSAFILLNWHQHAPHFPVLLFSLEMLLAGFRSTAAVNARPNAHDLASHASQQLRALLNNLCATFGSGPDVAPAASLLCVFRPLLACLQTDALMRHVSLQHWVAAIASLRRLANAVPLARTLLSDALLSAATLSVPPEAVGDFFSKTLQPNCQFILSPSVAPADSAAMLEAASFDFFHRFSTRCASEWKKRLRDLIPPSVHPKLVAYVQARRKEPPPAVGPGIQQSMITGVEGKSVAEIDARLLEIQQQLQAEAEALEQQHAQQAAQPAATQRRQEMVDANFSSVVFASVAMAQHQEDITYAGAAHAE